MSVIDRFARSNAWRSTTSAVLCTAALAGVPIAVMPANAQYIPGATGSGGGGGGGGSPGGSTNAVQYNAGSGNFGGVSLGTGKLLIGQSSGTPTAEAMGGDCALTAAGAITCLDSNGVPFGALATLGLGSGLSSAGGNLANSGVLTFNTRAGAVTLSSSDVTTALGFTPLKPANNLSDLSSAATARTNLALGTFATQNYATPPAIGATTPAAGSFSSLTDSGIAGSTQCVHANSSGTLSGTGSDCGSGGSTAFSALTGGTNSSAAMVVGTGGSLGVSGGGAINATTLGGATFAAPGSIGSGTAAAGAFTALAATGNLTTNVTGSTQCVHANSAGVLSGTGSDCGSGGGGGSLDVTDGTHSVTGTTTLTLGNGFVVGGSGGSATANVTVPDATQTGNYTIAAADMAGQENFNGTSVTATIPAIGATVFANGMSAIITNRNAGALTLSSTPTLNGLTSATSLYQYGWADCTSNGVSLDCFGFPGFGALSGDLTASGAGTTTLATVNSNVGSFTNANITVNAKGLITAASNGSGGGGGSATIILPQGRLTCTSGVAVMITDNASCTTLYYDAFKGGNQVPYYTGSTDKLDTVTAGEVSTALAASGTGVLNASGVFDVWWEGNTHHAPCVATNGSGSGGGWASDTGGSTTARGTGYSQLDQISRAYVTNKNAVAHCYNGTTDYGSIGANELSYLGTIYTVSAGTTAMQMSVAAAAGGGNPCLCVFNAYNQVGVKSRSMDNSASWTYGTVAWQALDAGAAESGLNNRVTWVDGLQQSAVEANLIVGLDNTSSSGAPLAGVDLDSSTATPEFSAFVYAGSNTQGTVNGTWSFNPQLGLHFAQAVEQASSANNQTWFGTTSGVQVEILQLHLAM